MSGGRFCYGQDTDDRLRNLAGRRRDKLALPVENPAKWYPEVVAP
jgi:hypothetical protein